MGLKKFTDIELIASLNTNKQNVTKAAKDLGVTRAAVIKRRDMLPKGVFADNIEDFRRDRADTFADLQKIILQYISPEKLKKASLAQLGTLFGIFYDKERLETNQSTEHIAHDHFQQLSENDRKLLRQTVKDMTERKRNSITYEAEGEILDED